MVRLFDIQNGEVIPAEATYTMETMIRIRQEYKEDYLKIFAYIFFMSCPNPDYNPFFDVAESEKEELIRREVGGSFDAGDDAIQDALKLCIELYETPTYRAYMGAKMFIDRVSKELSNNELTYGRDGNSMAMSRFAEKLNAYRETYKGAYNDLKEEQKGNARGGANIAYDG